MALVGNILWIILCGIELGLVWLLVGCLLRCMIVGIPFDIACFRIARVCFAPLGKKINGLVPVGELNKKKELTP